MVWIVLKNGKVDEVFDNEPAARLHAKNINRRWNLTDVIVKEVKSI